MLIELARHNFHITWPLCSKVTHQEIVRRLKTISGATFDRAEKCWWIPLAQGARLLEQFPRASYSVDAMWAATDAESDRARRFYESLRLMGIRLHIEGEVIVAVGEGVSPLLQELVTERAPALRMLVEGRL